MKARRIHGLEFWGASFVSDPFGRVIAEASHDKEEILIVECDVRKMEEVRRNWPFLRDRRIDAYVAHHEPVSHVMSRSIDYRMPAEWEPHEATWIAWPHNEDDWPGRFEPIPWVYGEIVRKLSQVERVRILVQNEDIEAAARTVCRRPARTWPRSSSYRSPPTASGRAISGLLSCGASRETSPP